MIAGSVQLERTFRDRYLRRPAPTLTLDRDQAAMIASDPLPLAYQTGFPAEYFVQLDEIVGRYPLGPFLPRYAQSLARGITDPDQLALAWPVPVAEPVPVLSIVNRAKHGGFRRTVPAADATLLPADDWRTYLLVVNIDPANAALVDFDQASDEGVPLSANGGFIELTTGTISEVRAQGVGGPALLKVVVGRAHPNRVCRLPCD